mmetsp:Transcript_20899/g.61842  ORF Transcript_20899/g.61842 Transcript_20899/m.61842 type:complete len:207 (-) Transcript_20899:33-653(-)
MTSGPRRWGPSRPSPSMTRCSTASQRTILRSCDSDRSQLRAWWERWGRNTAPPSRQRLEVPPTPEMPVGPIRRRVGRRAPPASVRPGSSSLRRTLRGWRGLTRVRTGPRTRRTNSRSPAPTPMSCSPPPTIPPRESRACATSPRPSAGTSRAGRRPYSSSRHARRRTSRGRSASSACPSTRRFASASSSSQGPRCCTMAASARWNS